MNKCQPFLSATKILLAACKTLAVGQHITSLLEDALVHDVRADDVLDARDERRHLVVQVVVVQEHHAHRGRHDQRPAAVLRRVVDRCPRAVVALVQVEEQRDEGALAGVALVATVPVPMEEMPWRP